MLFYTLSQGLVPELVKWQCLSQRKSELYSLINFVYAIFMREYKSFENATFAYVI